MALQLKIWGCRGSVPAPGPATAGYGGNTSCVEVLLDGDTALVLDAGTGIRALGDDLVRRGTRRIHLFLTHLHLDHLEGIRFFAPLWNDNVTLDIWGPKSPVLALRERIMRAFSPPLFPLDFRDVPARITFHDLPADPWRLGELSLLSDLVLHPGPTLGFRLEDRDSTVAYVPDHEPALTATGGRPIDWLSAGAIADSADVIFHDAQYLEDEYETRIGWGHSSVDAAVAFCRSVRARQLVLFHHEPNRSDDELEALCARARELSDPDGPPPLLAREGMTIEVPRA